MEVKKVGDMKRLMGQKKCELLCKKRDTCDREPICWDGYCEQFDEEEENGA